MGFFECCLICSEFICAVTLLCPKVNVYLCSLTVSGSQILSAPFSQGCLSLRRRENGIYVSFKAEISVFFTLDFGHLCVSVLNTTFYKYNFSDED